ncbi:hypothetical protein [Plantactinospora sp. KBS50]|uniref:hypothetical protein n=1 Tax=Plantactinospora sp. KBS50 TaxID=2024580 RepID=UPI0018DF1B80|nr:hypothetical protein [Plantactinospora sp. KBS50]
MATYREVLGVTEFRALFAGHSTTVVAKNMQQLALASLVFATTGSPLLAAVAFLAGLLPHAVVALSLLSLADRLPPRGALIAFDLGRAAALGLLAGGVLPLWAIFAVVLLAGAGDALAAAIRLALVADVLRDGYVAGRALLNIVVGVMQVLGYAVGGVLLSLVGAGGALCTAAGFSLLAAAVTRSGLRRHRPRGAGRGALRSTWAGNRAILGDTRARGLLWAHWIPNGLIVGAEALYIPYAGASASVLFVSAGVGMLVGDAVIGRLGAATRGRLILPALVLLAVPYLAFAWRPPVPVAAVLVAVASVGFGSTLGVQERLLRVLPAARHGQGLGLAMSGMMTMQAVAVALAGATAEMFGPTTAMAMAAAGSLAVTGALLPHVAPRWRAARTAAAALTAVR